MILSFESMGKILKFEMKAVANTFLWYCFCLFVCLVFAVQGGFNFLVCG